MTNPVAAKSVLAPSNASAPRLWVGVATWLVGWLALVVLDSLDTRFDLANLAMVLVLVAALAAWWLPIWASIAASVASVLAFNRQFVPPRGTFVVDQPEHALLLGAMVAVCLIVTMLMSLQRRHALLAARHAQRSEQLRAWSDTLRDADDPTVHLGELQTLLSALSGARATVMALKTALPASNDDAHVVMAGHADGDQHEGLWHCLRQGHAMGPGTGRHAHIGELYLPMRGRGSTLGAVVFFGESGVSGETGAAGMRSADWRGHAQALSDQAALALQRHQTAAEQQRVRDEARGQAVRNTLLAAISHDYRTPLATILGAAYRSTNREPVFRTSNVSGWRAASPKEAQRLRRMTDNTLQLARLGGPGVALRCDWESAEDLVGAAVRRSRRRDTDQRVRARLEPGLPLLWCDAMLMSQLIEPAPTPPIEMPDNARVP